MQARPLRLAPGADLRRSLEELARAEGLSGAFVVAGIGSLGHVRVRLAGASEELALFGAFEILTLGGSLSPDGAHLHMSIADETGRVVGGHVGYGNTVRTTAEVLLALLPDWQLGREPDPKTGYNELTIRKSSP